MLFECSLSVTAIINCKSICHSSLFNGGRNTLEFSEMLPLVCSWSLCKISLFDDCFKTEWEEITNFYAPYMSHISEAERATTVVTLKDPRCSPLHVFHLQCIAMLPMFDSWEDEHETSFQCLAKDCVAEFYCGLDLNFIPRNWYLACMIECDNGEFRDEI